MHHLNIIIAYPSLTDSVLHSLWNATPRRRADTPPVQPEALKQLHLWRSQRHLGRHTSGTARGTHTSTHTATIRTHASRHSSTHTSAICTHTRTHTSAISTHTSIHTSAIRIHTSKHTSPIRTHTRTHSGSHTHTCTRDMENMGGRDWFKLSHPAKQLRR